MSQKPFDDEIFHIRQQMGEDEKEIYIRPSLEREFRKMIREEIQREKDGLEPKEVPDRDE